MDTEYVDYRKKKQGIVRRLHTCIIVEKIISIAFFLLVIITFSRFEDTLPIALFATITVGYVSCRWVTQATKETLHAYQSLIATIFQGECYEAYDDWRQANHFVRDKATGRRLLKRLIRATRKEHQLRKMKDSCGLIATLKAQQAAL